MFLIIPIVTIQTATNDDRERDSQRLRSLSLRGEKSVRRSWWSHHFSP